MYAHDCYILETHLRPTTGPTATWRGATREPRNTKRKNTRLLGHLAVLCLGYIRVNNLLSLYGNSQMNTPAEAAF